MYSSSRSYSALSDLLIQASEQAKAIESSKKTLEDEVTSLKQQHTQDMTTVGSLQKAVTDAQALITQLTKTSQEKDLRIQSLATEVDGLKVKLDDTGKEHKQKYSALSTQLTDSIIKNSHLERQNREALEKIVKLTDQNLEYKTSASHYKEEIQRYKKRQQQDENMIRNFTKRLETVQTENEFLQTEKSETQQEVKYLSQTLQTLRRKRKKQRLDHKLNQHQINELKQGSKDQENEWKKILFETKDTATGLSSQLSQELRANSELKNKVHELRQQLSSHRASSTLTEAHNSSQPPVARTPVQQHTPRFFTSQSRTPALPPPPPAPYISPVSQPIQDPRLRNQAYFTQIPRPFLTAPPPPPSLRSAPTPEYHRPPAPGYNFSQGIRR